MQYRDITYAKRERVATITLNRPEAHNALTHLMLEEIEHAVDQCAKDDEVIAACNEHGLTMVFAGRRHFKH